MSLTFTANTIHGAATTREPGFTAGSAARVYFDRRRFPPTGGRVTVPTAFGLFPHDIDHGVESFARRWYPTVRFTRFPSGGHFGAMEHPDLLADDLRALLAKAF